MNNKELQEQRKMISNAIVIGFFRIVIAVVAIYIMFTYGK